MLRRFLLLAVLFAGGLTCPCRSLSETTPAPLTSDRLFEFHSGFWVNLHHFLYRAAVVSEPQKSSRPLSLVRADSEELTRLSAQERAVWDSAVTYYKGSIATRDLLFDHDLRAIKNELEDTEDSPDLTQVKIPAELKAILIGMAPIYRKHWWERHDAENRRWIAELKPLIGQYGSKIATEMETIYAEPWPQYPVRVDVAAYANWSGAYTTIHPTRPTLSTTEEANQGAAALEILFHETSHGMMDKVMDAMREADAAVSAHRSGRPFESGSLWHAVLFYTAGELVREQIPGYVPYADKNGVWVRGWPDPDRSLIERDWKPHMSGSVGLQQALSQLVSDVAAASSAK